MITMNDVPRKNNFVQENKFLIYLAIWTCDLALLGSISVTEKKKRKLFSL